MVTQMATEENVAEVDVRGLPDSGRRMRSEMGLLSEQDLSVLLDIQARTLQKWRSQKVGPDFVRLGKIIFYRRADVEEWITHNVVMTKRVMCG